jgi:osmoprotectant transport system substrate-binding protein
MKPTRLLSVPLAVLALTAGGCGSGGDAKPTATPEGSGGPRIVHRDANAKVSLRIGSKDFTEQRVLGQIYAQGLAAAGYTVATDLGLADERIALDAVESGKIDAYPEYTGTALLSFFGRKPAELPKDPQAAFREAKRGFARRGLVAFPPTPFTSSNEVAVTKKTAQKLGLRKISDLARHADELTLYGSPQCRQRLDCLRGLREVYGLRFKRFVPVDVAQRHDVLTSGKADVSIVFTTDPQIQREGEVLLQDDKGMFPPYNSTLVMRKDAADRAGPDLAKTIQAIEAQLTDENMQELNARVDLDGQQPAAVAKAYLRETGLVAG